MQYRIEVTFTDGGSDVYLSAEYPRTGMNNLVIRLESGYHNLPLVNIRSWKAELR